MVRACRNFSSAIGAEKDNPIFAAQVLTYLKLTNLKLGLVINFGKTRIIDGYQRVANGLEGNSASSAPLRLCVENPTTSGSDDHP